MAIFPKTANKMQPLQATGPMPMLQFFCFCRMRKVGLHLVIYCFEFQGLFAAILASSFPEEL